MQKPLLHPTSDQILSLIMRDPPQSLLITGEEGVGLGTIAAYIAHMVGGTVLTLLPEKDEKVDIEKGTITVKLIRRLYDDTRTIQPGKRVIVIDYAERMATTAQNAFLKLLEEPGEGTYFILATHSPSKLLPTIRSRAQAIEFHQLTRNQTDAYLDELGVKESSKRLQLTFMADGLPAELHRLVNNTEYFEKSADIVRDARDLLQATTYAKLHVAQKYQNDRESALKLVLVTTHILRRSITENPQASLIMQVDGLLRAYQQIKANGNIRLCLARFVL
jgi:DNA polymerase-3 subunit delta'